MFRMYVLVTYLIMAYGLFINPINGNTYPGLRRRPPPLTSIEETNILTQFVEDLARRRFQQKLVQDQFYNHLSQHNQNGPNSNPILDEDYNSAPGQSFAYEFPEINHDIDPTGEIEFAVNPSDPRYYEGRTKNPITLNDGPLNNGNSITSTKNMLNSYDLITTQNNNNNNNNNNHQHHNINKEVNGKGIFANNNSNKSVKDILFNKVKPPMDINSKTTPSLHSLFLPKPFRGRDDIAKLVQKLQQEGNANAVINGNPTSLLNGQRTQEVVVKERVGDNDVSMYMVALLSGITAAVLVGFMALGIAWITLQRRTKAAADVDYPAYGVTGPNKDLSPSGDKRLAQSAQLYHYQHQKQQIIGMENRQPPEQTTGQSDVESDDDNEEGDYTVYECPGLASTGEMEVKNPLFVDETPVTTPLSTTASTAVTSTIATTPSATSTNTTNSPKHMQKFQNKPQSQQVQSVKQQQQQQPTNISSPSASPTPQQQQQQDNSRSQSPNSPNRSPKSAKKEKQPPPTPQRRHKTGNNNTTPSTQSSSSSSSTTKTNQSNDGNNDGVGSNKK